MTADGRTAAVLGARTSRRRTIVELYLSREPDARYDRHLGYAAGLAVGVPALAAETTGPAHFWILVAIGAWLAVIPAPPAPARERIRQSLRSAALTIAATAVGLATGDRLWALVAASLVFAVIISLPGITAIPLIALVIAAEPSSLAAPVHLGAIVLGSVWSSALVMTPWLGGRYGDPVRGPPTTPCCSASDGPGRSCSRRRRPALRRCAMRSGSAAASRSRWCSSTSPTRRGPRGR